MKNAMARIQCIIRTECGYLAPSGRKCQNLEGAELFTVDDTLRFVSERLKNAYKQASIHKIEISVVEE